MQLAINGQQIQLVDKKLYKQNHNQKMPEWWKRQNGEFNFRFDFATLSLIVQGTLWLQTSHPLHVPKPLFFCQVHT